MSSDHRHATSRRHRPLHRPPSPTLEALLLASRSHRGQQSTSDSWIELSSQPSSSTSLSPAADDRRLNVPPQHHHAKHRRRRLPRNPQNRVQADECATTGTSSQDEYDESESESDRVMTSSNEGLDRVPYAPERRILPSSTASAGDEDDDATGVEQSCFTPQPNMFSHPPSSMHRTSEGIPGSYFPSHPPTRQASQRHSYPGQSQPRHSHAPYNITSPSQHADHDAALRASLSTLLSCAAAARGLPKTDPQAPPSRAQHNTARVDPSSLRMVPEAVIHSRQQGPRRASSSTTSTSSESVDALNAADLGKRKAATRSTSKDRHAAKKARRVVGVDEAISPTLLTWVVSAGVIVVVSALSFSAGYTVGHEAGTLEALDSTGLRSGAAAGKGAARGGMSLRRLRWSGAGSVAVGA